jgi:carboxyl-terminal processing protease
MNMLKLKKIAVMLLCTLIISTLLPITAGAYDYNDYLKDAAGVTGHYSDSERVYELAETITKTYPDYWEATDKVQVLYDATAKLADKNDDFYRDFLDAMLYFQEEYGLNATDVEKTVLTNLENLEAQFDFTTDIIKNQDLFKAAMNKLLTEKPEYTDILIAEMMSFTDEYSRYIKATDYYINQNDDTVGMGVMGGDLGEGFVVLDVYSGTGAEAAGIEAGDIVTAIDGVPYTFDNQVTARGPENTTFEATILREDGSEVTLTVKRIKYSEGVVTSERYDDTVIIGFKSFELMSDAEDFEKFYDAAAADPTVKKLVIDLRDNVGGDQEVLEAMASVILPKDIRAFTIIEKDKQTVYRSKGKYKGAGKKFEGQLFVLTNGNTASCADIFTAAIKFRGGIQVGETTYGKGIGQNGYILHNGYMAWITGMIVDVPYNGRYHGKGFVPNVKISERVTLYTEDEIIRLKDTDTPIDETTAKSRIKAFEQEVQAVLGVSLEADGVLDKRTAYLVNGIRFFNGLPPLDFGAGIVIDSETIKLIHNLAEDTGMTNFTTVSEVDKALEYCLKYKVKTADKAA